MISMKVYWKDAKMWCEVISVDGYTVKFKVPVTGKINGEELSWNETQQLDDPDEYLLENK